MIFGDTLLLTKKGIEINSKVLETIGVFEDTKVHILPLRTFEYRKEQESEELPLDLLLTPMNPKVWPFVLRFELRLYNSPKALENAYKFLYQLGINILFAESTRSGHHHTVLNVLGVIKRLEGMSLGKLVSNVKGIYNDRKKKFNKNLWQETITALYKKQQNVEVKPNWSFHKAFHENIDDYEKLKKDEKTTKAAEIIASFIKYHYFNEVDKLSDDNILKKSKFDEAIQVILHEEIKRVRPIIRNYKEVYKYNKQELYRIIELENLPIKVMLNLVLVYKQYLIDNYEVLFLKDTLLKDIEKYNLFEGENNSFIKDKEKEEVYIYNLKHYKDVFSFTSYLKEWFMDKIDRDDFLERHNKIVKLCEGVSESNRKYISNLNLAKIDEKVKSKLQKLLKETTVKKSVINEYQDIISKYSSIKLDDELLNDEKLESLFHLLYYSIQVLPSGRKGLISNDARIDLDPIIITPVESLNHAYYHLAYHEDFSTIVEQGRVPFPKKTDDKYPYEIINEYFTEKYKTTSAVTSRNTDDLTLRLSPIPQKLIYQYFYVTLKNFSRRCFMECVEFGLEQFGNNNVSEVLNLNDINKNCSHDKVSNKNEQNNEDGECDKDGKRCKGTSRGVILSLYTALNNLGGKDVTVLRAYSQEAYNDSRSELGSIKLLIRIKGRVSLRNRIQRDLQKEMECVSEKFGVSKHLKQGSIIFEELSSGRVFISLKFNHPMTKTWVNIIKKEAVSLGFEILIAETYVSPVTENVSYELSNCDAMLQILANPLPDANDNVMKKTKHSGWLDAEYLTAIHNDIPVIRMIDKKSVILKDINIGRDHAPFYFDITKPEDEFAKVVRKAFVELRKAIAKKLSLS